MSGRKSVTGAHPFFRTTDGDNLLFQVQPGVDLQSALEAGSCFLDVAIVLIRDAAQDMDGEHPTADCRLNYAAGYLCEMGKAIMDSVAGSLFEADRGAQPNLRRE